jgi:hypothetical protein
MATMRMTNPTAPPAAPAIRPMFSPDDDDAAAVGSTTAPVPLVVAEDLVVEDLVMMEEEEEVSVTVRDKEAVEVLVGTIEHGFEASRTPASLAESKFKEVPSDSCSVTPSESVKLESS